MYVILLLLSAILMWPFAKKKFLIKRWKRRYNIDQHRTAFSKLFLQVNGFELSKKAREQHDAFEYVYGEIEFISFVALLAQCNPDKDTVFYDLGSGTGKAVFACAMVFDIKKCYGIELFTLLHKAAEQQLDGFKQIPAYKKKADKITFIHGNFLNTDFNDGSLIFINSTALIGPTWDKLKAKLVHTPVGTTVITTSKPLSLPDFSLTHTSMVEMSWGVVQAFTQVRNNSLFSSQSVDNIE